MGKGLGPISSKNNENENENGETMRVPWASLGLADDSRLRGMLYDTYCEEDQAVMNVVLEATGADPGIGEYCGQVRGPSEATKINSVSYPA
jgi:hypothetical protein